MTERTRGYAHRIDVAADAQAVWTAITTPAVGLWCSPDARVNARQGGSFRASVDRITELLRPSLGSAPSGPPRAGARGVQIAPGDLVEAYIDIFIPERRMRLIHLRSPALPATETAIVDDFMLDAAPGGVMLRLLGSGFPVDETWDAIYLRRRTGWERALARLKVLIEREAPPASDAAGGGLG